MADSIPSLRRKLAEAQAEIKRLRDMAPEVKTVEVIKYVDREVMVPGPERVVVEEIVVHEKGETKIVEVPVDVVRTEYQTVYVDREVYVDNPEHLRTIEVLQEKLAEWQNISQSDS